MAIREIKVKAPNAGEDGSGRQITVTYDIPESAADMIAKWGDAVVADKFISAVIVEIQAKARTALGYTDEDYMSDDAIQQLVNEYAPKVAGPKKTKLDRGFDLFASMSDEERTAFLKKARDAEKAKKAEAA